MQKESQAQHRTLPSGADWTQWPVLMSSGDADELHIGFDSERDKRIDQPSYAGARNGAASSSTTCQQRNNSDNADHYEFFFSQEQEPPLSSANASASTQTSWKTLRYYGESLVPTKSSDNRPRGLSGASQPSLRSSSMGSLAYDPPDDLVPYPESEDAMLNDFMNYDDQDEDDDVSLSQDRFNISSDEDDPSFVRRRSKSYDLPNSRSLRPDTRSHEFGPVPFSRARFWDSQLLGQQIPISMPIHRFKGDHPVEWLNTDPALPRSYDGHQTKILRYYVNSQPRISIVEAQLSFASSISPVSATSEQKASKSLRKLSAASKGLWEHSYRTKLRTASKQGKRSFSGLRAVSSQPIKARNGKCPEKARQEPLESFGEVFARPSYFQTDSILDRPRRVDILSVNSTLPSDTVCSPLTPDADAVFLSQLIPRSFCDKERNLVLHLLKSFIPGMPLCVIEMVPPHPEDRLSGNKSRRSGKAAVKKLPASSKPFGPNGEGWPTQARSHGRHQKALPVEIFEMIGALLPRESVQNMRLVNREFEAKISCFAFKSVVVPFEPKIYGTINTQPDDMSGMTPIQFDRSELANEPTYNAKYHVQDGMRVFEEWGPMIKKFALTFEVAEGKLQYPSS
ncbi:MAG: hypothetical protein Q9222_007056 [Ikaeria aurantiellina]